MIFERCVDIISYPKVDSAHFRGRGWVYHVVCTCSRVRIEVLPLADYFLKVWSSGRQTDFLLHAPHPTPVDSANHTACGTIYKTCFMPHLIFTINESTRPNSTWLNPKKGTKVQCGNSRIGCATHC